ncbi:hypothetical protein [Microbacterium halophytorum]|uniref:hypothetical protein n=1 Tax=Microbacterium halophytorum TaxID=2067568 RepID=UPI000CFABF9F|nr:hypothetical protein [Microbacterium halophytorum]
MSEKAENTNRGMIATLVVVAIAAVAVIIFAVTQLGGAGNDDVSAPAGTETSAPADDDGAEGTDEAGDASEETGDDMKTIKTTTYLPESLGGQEAIDALGDDLAAVAELNNKTPEELEEFLLKNPSAKISPNGTILIP